MRAGSRGLEMRTPSPRGRDTRKRSSKCSYEVAVGNMYTYANSNETE